MDTIKWQEAFEQLSKLMKEYEQRKSKFIKYVPTEKELREAMRFYMLINDRAKEKDPDGIKLMEILKSISDVPEIQIKFTGFMDEILKQYPNGKIPHQVVMDAAEKWDVLEYVVEDIIRILGIKINQ